MSKILTSIFKIAGNAYTYSNLVTNILPKEFYLGVQNQNGQTYIDWSVFKFSGTKTINTKLGKVILKKNLSPKKTSRNFRSTSRKKESSCKK